MYTSALKDMASKSEEIQHIYVNEQTNCHICSPWTTALDTVFNYNINWSFVTTNENDNITFYFTSRNLHLVSGKCISGEKGYMGFKKII